jgi:hypothetical protein
MQQCQNGLKQTLVSAWLEQNKLNISKVMPGFTNHLASCHQPVLQAFTTSAIALLR